ncbi:MAG: hypothetical protein Q8O56_12710 [Solirubrobacteraceae bacterium]|nr:hypothetical protein [Solirubrobacteraceae bacterium]
MTAIRFRLRSRRALGLALVLAAVTGGVALAQTDATPPPVGNYGGGAIAVPVSERTVARDMLLSVRAQAGGRVGVNGTMFASCGLGLIKGDTRLAADGSFTLRGSTTRRPLVGVAETATFTVRGRLTADGGEGTASLRLRVRASGNPTRTCASRTVNWTVRRPIATGAAPAPARAGTTLLGLTSQSAPRSRHAIALRVSASGRTIERATLGFRAPCADGRLVAPHDVNVSPEFDIAEDGSFRFVERFRTTFPDVIQRTTVVVRGQFDEAGGATGASAVTQRYQNRRTGKRVDICASGTRTWSARP